MARIVDFVDGSVRTYLKGSAEELARVRAVRGGSVFLSGPATLCTER
jgi:hypothetical protein